MAGLWVGTVAFLDHNPETDTDLEARQTAAHDLPVYLSDLNIEASKADSHWWPTPFNHNPLLALDDRLIDRTFFLRGTGNVDSIRREFRGFAQQVPDDKHWGMPGFSRFVGVVYNLADPEERVVEIATDWGQDFFAGYSMCFEGAILPGNQVMLGRAFQPNTYGEPCSGYTLGPFIFWAA